MTIVVLNFVQGAHTKGTAEEISLPAHRKESVFIFIAIVLPLVFMVLSLALKCSRPPGFRSIFGHYPITNTLGNAKI